MKSWRREPEPWIEFIFGVCGRLYTLEGLLGEIDGCTQERLVTTQYLQQADGSVEPQKIHTMVISTQHAGPLKATR